MASENEVKISKTDVEHLQHLLDILHLFHHRNKNQHRRSIWWRYFSTFRRQLNALVVEARRLHEAPTSHLERSRKKTRDQETKTNLAERCIFWRDTLVPKWQNSFSQIVADGRFAVLGLVLLAALAEACQITDITTAYEDLGQEEVEKVLEQFSEEHWMEGIETDAGSSVLGEDLGEAVSRDDTDRTLVPIVTSSERHGNTVRQIITAASDDRPPRTKRKKANAIDDLFSGLD